MSSSYILFLITIVLAYLIDYSGVVVDTVYKKGKDENRLQWIKCE